MYMFAALLAAVAHYIYFRFIDHGYVINTCETMVDTLAQSNMPGMDSYIATYQEALETARLLSPIDITLQMISSNVFWGSILAFPTALFVMRRKERRRSGRVTEQQKRNVISNCKNRKIIHQWIFQLSYHYIMKEESLPELFAWIERVMNAKRFFIRS